MIPAGFAHSMIVLVFSMAFTYAEAWPSRGGMARALCEATPDLLTLGMAPLSTATDATLHGSQATSETSMLPIQITVLAAMVALSGIVINYVLNVRRALKAAIKEETPRLLKDIKGHLESNLSEYDRKASASAEHAYVSAMQAIQASFACANGCSSEVDPRYIRIGLKKLMIMGSLLQIQYGQNDEVIAGANNICHLAAISVAIEALVEGLKRPDISDEAKEILQSRFDELARQ